MNQYSDEDLAKNEYTIKEKQKVLESNNLTFKIVNLTKTFFGFFGCSIKNAVNHVFIF